MKKLTLDFPTVRFIDTNERAIELNMKEFVNYTLPDLNNPYRKILLLEIFNQAYILNGKLVWDNVLEMTMCGGDSNSMSAEFRECELLEFLKFKQTEQPISGKFFNKKLLQ